MRGFLRFTTWALAIVAVLGVVLYLTVLDIGIVASDDPAAAASVEPSLTAGDRFLVLRNGNLKDGYLVRCADPDAPGRDVIGRIGGTAGESVEVKGGSLIVNGTHVPAPHGCTDSLVMMPHPITGADVKLQCGVEETAGTQHEYLTAIENTEVTKANVEMGKVFLVSDNRFLHLDSRDFGQVDPSTCKHVVFRMWGSSGIFDASHRLTLLW